MKRVKLVVAYDGTNYCGWQVQPNEITIEGVLNKHISELTGEDIKVIGASRTDSGVHALGNVAVFDTESRIPGEDGKSIKCKTSRRYHHSGFQRSVTRLPSKISGYKKDIRIYIL